MPDEEEPPVREFADRGTLWLLESPQNLQGFVRLVAQEIADKLDFERAQRLNRSFIPEDLQKHEADLLYRVPFRQGKSEVWIYVLLEHQSRPDRTMGLRLLSYMVQLWEAQRRGWQDAKTPVSQWRLHPIVPIVFYTGKRRWTSPLSLEALMDAPALLARFVPRQETLFLKLQETDPNLLTNANSAIAYALRALQVAEQPHETLAAALAEVVRRLEALPEADAAAWRRAMQYLYLLVRHKREPEEQERLFQVMDEAIERHAEEMREIKMTGAQALLSQGRREGRQEGRREVLLEQLEFKFGSLPEGVAAAVNALPEQAVIDLAKRVLSAVSLDELKLPSK